MEHAWKLYWSDQEDAVKRDFLAVHTRYERNTKRGEVQEFNTWSGKSVRQMAIETDHVEAYDVFYAYLSTFVHAAVGLPDAYLRVSRDHPGRLVWTEKPTAFLLTVPLFYSATFLTCFLKLFGRQFGVWRDDDVEGCWRCQP